MISTPEMQTSTISNSRIKSLDYLRGLMAFSIMIYHFYGASVQKIGADTTLSRIGIYGVSITPVLLSFAVYRTIKFPLMKYGKKLTLRLGLE
jgi:peptidoglycan/LPS O-acetylase OafA/YrhL